MPPTRKRRNDDGPGMQIEWEGKTYLLRESDLSPRDVAAIRRETGFPGWVGLMQESKRGFDIDVLAALVWLARRMAGDEVPYDTVLDSMSYDAEVNISVEDKRKKAEPEGASPEA